MKKIDLIYKLYYKAIERAHHELDNISVVEVNRRQQQIYQLTYDQPNEIMTLTHYGTMTLMIDVTNKTVLEWYGESVSDRDSMNSLLVCLRMDDEYCFRYGPVMGFVMEQGGERYEHSSLPVSV